MNTDDALRFGPNSAKVQRILHHASVMLPTEAAWLADMMVASWSYGRTNGRFPPFLAALGSACQVGVSSGRQHQVRAARNAVRLPAVGPWERSSGIARVGMRITAVAFVVKDLLPPAQFELLVDPYRSLRGSHRVAARIA